MKNTILGAFFLSLPTFAFSQTSEIDTIFVVDNKLNNDKDFITLQTLSDKDLLKNSSNLSDVLRFQTPIFIKENGRGMVSSPSFRGTTAQQTAFIWNGINLNSIFLSQGDINNIGLFGSDKIDIKSGGGSLKYGSGAIGGSIHFNDTFTFNKGAKTTFLTEAGSYDTYQQLLKTSYSNDKFSLKVSGRHFISQNDYEVAQKNYKNLNGRYYNTSFSLGLAYKISSQQTLTFLSELLDNKQHYPIYETSSIPTRYKSSGSRHLLDWTLNSSKVKNSLKIAYVEDDYHYFSNPSNNFTSGGLSKTATVKNDFEINLLPGLDLNIIGDYRREQGEGIHTGVEKSVRSIYSLSGLLKYRYKKLYLEAGAKKDEVEGIHSPFLYSISTHYQTSAWHSVSLNFSKNFRYGSFNDLYWQPGGNPNLKPETSQQFELLNHFKWNNLKVNVAAYHMSIDQLIRWVPSTGEYWIATNTDNVKSYGLETNANYTIKLPSDKTLVAHLGYTYTKSVNEVTKKQLSFVPLHKLYGGLEFNSKRISGYVQGFFNGTTYTTSDENNLYSLQPYAVFNIGASAPIVKHLSIGGRINNITNTTYQTTGAAYWMPLRNYAVNLTLNF